MLSIKSWNCLTSDTAISQNYNSMRPIWSTNKGDFLRPFQVIFYFPWCSVEIQRPRNTPVLYRIENANNKTLVLIYSLTISFNTYFFFHLLNSLHYCSSHKLFKKILSFLSNNNVIPWLSECHHLWKEDLHFPQSLWHKIVLNKRENIIVKQIQRKKLSITLNKKLRG